MGREEAEELVASALALAMSRDGSSGGVIRCVPQANSTACEVFEAAIRTWNMGGYGMA
jgi:20S proteasome alpha/beta subunit